MATKLDTLFHYLDHLEQRASLSELRALLKRLDLTCDDVAGFMRFAEGHYQRNLIRAGPWYHAWALCWKNGQRSPIHDHAGSVCCVRVLRGTATVTLFEKAPNGHIKAAASQDYAPGT